MVGVSKEMGLGVGLGVELQVRDSWYGLGLETGLESWNLVCWTSCILSCHGNYTAGHSSKQLSSSEAC